MTDTSNERATETVLFARKMEKHGTTKAVTGSAYLDALQLWLFPQLEESEPNNFIWQQDGAPSHWDLEVRDWLNIHCTQPMDWPQRVSRYSLYRMASTFTRSDAI
ncbi:uncharacterized protein TNCV_3892971 [Trichonephila clavipes]|nr:uncharacterized protein TNCV_3892971 [Trichonephila clavipes]